MNTTQQLLTAAVITAGLFILPIGCVIAITATAGLIGICRKIEARV